MDETTEQENSRNPDGTFKTGFSGNPGGRPKNSLKSYVAKKLAKMSDAEKEEWLKDIGKEFQWKMGEGQPRQGITGEDEDGKPFPLLGGLSNGNNNNGNQRVAETEEEN